LSESERNNEPAYDEEGRLIR